MRSEHPILDYEPITRSRRAQSPEPDAASTDWSPHTKSSSENVEPRGRVKHLPAPSPTSTTRMLVIKSGHALSYMGLFLFTTVLYFRPYELFPALSSLTSIAFYLAIFTLIVFLPTQLVLEGNLTTRPREVNLVLLLCLAALLSMPLAIDPALAWDTFFNQEFIKAVIMFIVIVNVVRTKRRLSGLLFLALAVSFMLSVNALRDYSSGRFSVDGDRIAGSIGGMFGNPNDMALHLVTITPIAVALALSARNIFMKLLYGICAILVVAANIVTFSRGGFLGLVAVGLCLAWKLGRRNRLLVMALTFVVIFLFIGLAPGGYGKRLSSIFDSGLDPNGSSTARSELFKRSLLVAVRNPVVGIGMGNFPIVGIQNQVSHNAYTQVAAEMGAAAFVIYVMFMVAPLRRLRKIERATFAAGGKSRFYYLSIGIQAALIGYMVGSFFASVAYQFYVYYLVGYAVCLRRIYEAEMGLLEELTPSNNERASKNRREPAASVVVESKLGGIRTLRT